VWELFRQITGALFKSEKERIYLLDGFVVTAAYSLKNVAEFGQHRTPRGHVHHPKVQLVTAHALGSGKAICPSIGTVKENEIRLSFPIFARVDKPSLFIADRGFGIFAVAHAVQQNGHTALLRLTDKRCKALCGTLPQSGERLACTWHASTDTKRTFPELQEAEGINGAVFACANKSDRNKLIYFFTTSALMTDKLSKLYERRIEVETYIRHLKQTLALEFVTSKTPEMIEKEIAVAFTTFNLMCDIINRAAKLLNLEPRRISFSSLLSLLEAQEEAFLTAETSKQIKFATERFLSYLNASKIPLRKKPRQYPRVTCTGRSKYPTVTHEKLQALRAYGK
jgi:hypothetical protein